MTEIIENWIKEIWIWADENNIDSSTIPRSKDALLALDSIDLSAWHWWLDSFSRGLCFLPHVTSLDLEDNNLKELPKEIVNFKNLKILNLKYNSLVLTNIQKRWIEQLKEKGCEVYLVADNVKKQNTYHFLTGANWMERLWWWADENHIPENNLPRTEHKLLSLTKLCLSGNKITMPPKEIGNLTNLEELNLENNCLHGLPEEIGNLTNLKELNLAGNNFYRLPEAIGNLTNLEELNLGNNCLHGLPEEIGNLSNLTKLNLSQNTNISLSKEIGGLSNLKELSVVRTNINILPKEIACLENLTSLRFQHSHITSFPEEIINLKKLEWCDFSGDYAYILCKSFSPQQHKWIDDLKEKGSSMLFIGMSL